MDNNKRVLVALSGGVDSAVAAWLLKEKGYRVSASYMKTWMHEDGSTILSDCPWEDDIKYAEAVSAHIGIDFEVIDFVKDYREKIVSYLVKGYQNGNTPNPDLMCNREMKFGVFLDHAKDKGFDMIATGHYARFYDNADQTRDILEGSDGNKDQSYFLALVKQEQLNDVIFPIGDYKKPEIRKIAEKAALPNASRKDSQGICFLGKVKINEFLEQYIEDKPGEIVTPSGEHKGQHKGLHRYTIGQRRGIDVPSNTDNEYFVVIAKDYSNNQLIIDFDHKNAPGLYVKKARLRNLHFINKPVKKPGRLLGKPRYRDPSTPISYTPTDDGAFIEFDETQRALAPGQLLALYDGNKLLGGGFYY